MQIEEIKQKIYDLYDECLDNLGQFHRKLDLFIVPVELAQRIKEITDLDVSDHWVCIDNYGILHTLEQHGNPISEAKRGQVAIEKEDFFKMLDVFLYPEEIVLVGKTSHTQKPILQFVRQIEDKVYVVKEVRTITSKKKNKLSRLVFHTMYKIKATNRTAEAVD
ncbi:MAG: hypothetical protein ACOVO2_03465 [Emticicia sp.]|uniref:PBECR3 domain-containing polyvalent protein n=1 Tax=Emticicia sp. TaxID=1930953 RepID=UPI003BA72DAA